MRITEIITLFILKHKDIGLTWSASVPSSNVFLERREQTVTVSAPVKTRKREIRVLRVVTVLDWDGQRLTVVLVVSAMMDENYG
jgi:hypothetical protein